MSRNYIHFASRRLSSVAPREGRVSRNKPVIWSIWVTVVAPREGRVSRNARLNAQREAEKVAPREGRVSRNASQADMLAEDWGRAPRGACE